MIGDKGWWIHLRISALHTFISPDKRPTFGNVSLSLKKLNPGYRPAGLSKENVVVVDVNVTDQSAPIIPEW